MAILSTQNQHMMSAAAAYTTSGCWLVTQGCCKRVLFNCLFMQMTFRGETSLCSEHHTRRRENLKSHKQVYASEGNLEQTINCICDVQTLNQGSDFVKGPDFNFLNAKLCIT
jgi:hypothetical protein